MPDDRREHSLSMAMAAEGRMCAAADTAKRECQAEMWARPAAR
jgi:hypothetical protein